MLRTEPVHPKECQEGMNQEVGDGSNAGARSNQTCAQATLGMGHGNETPVCLSSKLGSSSLLALWALAK